MSYATSFPILPVIRSLPYIAGFSAQQWHCGLFFFPGPVSWHEMSGRFFQTLPVTFRSLGAENAIQCMLPYSPSLPSLAPFSVVIFTQMGLDILYTHAPSASSYLHAYYICLLCEAFSYLPPDRFLILGSPTCRFIIAYRFFHTPFKPPLTTCFLLLKCKFLIAVLTFTTYTFQIFLLNLPQLLHKNIFICQAFLCISFQPIRINIILCIYINMFMQTPIISVLIVQN